MAKYTVKKIDEMEAIYGGAFKRARAELGVESFGMQVMDLPPNIGDQYPEHDHAEDGQEEVYLPLSGRVEVEVEGERVALEPGSMVRVGPGVKRRIRTGSEPCRLLALGGAPGKVYEPPEMSKLGSPDPLLQQQT
jgi:mannose-6-phosphate isomerase-like protein (cupin superfamily)